MLVDPAELVVTDSIVVVVVATSDDGLTKRGGRRGRRDTVARGLRRSRRRKSAHGHRHHGEHDGHRSGDTPPDSHDDERSNRDRRDRDDQQRHATFQSPATDSSQILPLSTEVPTPQRSPPGPIEISADDSIVLVPPGCSRHRHLSCGTFVPVLTCVVKHPRRSGSAAARRRGMRAMPADTRPRPKARRALIGVQWNVSCSCVSSRSRGPTSLALVIGCPAAQGLRLTSLERRFAFQGGVRVSRRVQLGLPA